MCMSLLTCILDVSRFCSCWTYRWRTRLSLPSTCCANKSSCAKIRCHDCACPVHLPSYGSVSSCCHSHQWLCCLHPSLPYCPSVPCSWQSSQAMQSICSSCLTRKDLLCRSTSKLVLINMSRRRRHASGLLCVAGRQLGGALYDPVQCHPVVEHLPSV